MEAKTILHAVSEQLNALNYEFKDKKVHWKISDPETVAGKLKISVATDNKGKFSEKLFYIWRRNDDIFYLHNEDDNVEPQIVFKEHLFKSIAISTYGGQVLGTSLMPENWSERQFRHLNVVPAT